MAGTPVNEIASYQRARFFGWIDQNRAIFVNFVEQGPRLSGMAARQPNVNENTFAPASRNSISNSRSATGHGCWIS
jgi:hypothetical protein